MLCIASRFFIACLQGGDAKKIMSMMMMHSLGSYYAPFFPAINFHRLTTIALQQFAPGSDLTTEYYDEIHFFMETSGNDAT